MVCQLRPLTYSLGLNNTPRISFNLVKLSVKNIRHFKQAVSRRKMAGAGFHSIAKLCAQIVNPVLTDRGVRSADCHNKNSRPADCQTEVSKFESRSPQAWNARRVRIRPEREGWQSAEHWRADCQGDNIVVAVCEIRAWGLAMEWNPAPANLHRETSCLKCRIYLKSDFTSLKLVLGALFRYKQYVKGLSWHTISWYYTFKLKEAWHENFHLPWKLEIQSSSFIDLILYWLLRKN
jgi:hypothetical protein